MTRFSAGIILLLSLPFPFQISRAAQNQPVTQFEVKAQAKASEVDLSWDPVSGAASYNIYRSTSASLPRANWPKIGDKHAGTTFQASALTSGTQYYFLVTAVDSSGNEFMDSKVASAAPLQASGTPAGQQSAKPPTTNSATTNVGGSNTNVQNPVIALRPIDQLPSILSKDAGTLSWDDDLVSKMIDNACKPKPAKDNPQDNPTLPSFSFDHASTYALINVLRFNGTPDSQTVQSTNWYIYSKQRHWYRGWVKGWGVSDFDGSTRMYGAGTVVLVSIVLNNQNAAAPSISYKMTITKQQPSNIASVYSLLGVVFPGTAPVPGAETKPDYWGCSVVPIAFKTASLQTDTTLSSGQATPFTASVTFVNEPKEWWDVSFALPVTKVNQLQYSDTANTVTPTQINKQSLFAVFDLYIPPANLSTTSYNLIPHPFAGVAMNSQPLHSLLLGASIGLHLAEVYAGAVLVKQQSLSGLTSGSTATPAQLSAATSSKYNASFSFGIKISVKAAVSAFSSSKSK